MRLFCTVFEIQRLFVEIHQLLPTRPAFGTPLGVSSFKFRQDLWHQKTRVPGLSCGFDCFILHLAILVEHRLVTDKHTQTHRHRAMTYTRQSTAQVVKTI